MKIWLDDVRPPPDGWTWAKSPSSFWAEMAIAETADIEITAISFDNDLGDGKTEGWELVNSLLKILQRGVVRPLNAELSCHSMNPVAKARIEATLEDIRNLREIT